MENLKEINNPESFTEKTKPVSLVIDKNGKKWIRIRTLDMDVLIDIKNYKEGEEDRFTWYELKEREEKGVVRMPSRKQWKLINLYREEINELAKKENGDPIEGAYWTNEEVAQSYGDSSWLYGGYHGCLHTNGKCNSYQGRSLVYPNELQN